MLNGKWLPLSFLAISLAMLAFALPAYADTDAAACQVNGTAATDEVPLTGPSARGATYQFSSGLGGTALNLTCAGSDTTSGEVAVANLTASSSGTYNNVVCGTGTAVSSANAVTSTSVVFDSPPAGGVPTSLAGAVSGSQYHIQFAGGLGTLTFSGAITGGGDISIAANGDEQTNSAPGSAAQADTTGTGVQPGGRNDCTNHFTVTGTLAATFTGSGGSPGPTPPANVVPPVVSGVPMVGQTLTTTNGIWSGTQPMSFSYAWLRCNPSDVIGSSSCSATGNTGTSYTPTTSDIGFSIRSQVTASNSAGTGSATSPPTPPVQDQPGGVLQPMPYPPSTYPSQGCTSSSLSPIPLDIGSGGGPTGTDLVRAYLYPAQLTSTKFGLCVRAQTSTASEGGRLEIETAPGVAPVDQVADTDTSPPSCTQQGPSGFGLFNVTFGQSGNQVSVCVSAGGAFKRITVGTTGTGTGPEVCWIPDPDDTNTATVCKP